ncbi:MAG: tRNA (adenosine(37)-N6)-threonylcarbamoyltransferase complex dimerization subunit type 1 TsaB [Rhodospirillaceae bacterium]|nr:tRNA (adenosine(37)-N6)-threonylcarbamoyltransferase complex dimerization subunit type 1 TsaB [Rhodospirillaceae bacterium]
MTTILAIESGGSHCSVCLWQSGSQAMRMQETTQGAVGSIIPLIELLLCEAKISLKQLDQIAVSVGPGSYTGLRIGLAAAQGLGFSLGIPVFGVCSFLALASAAATEMSDNRAILVLLDGKRQDVFARFYTHQAKPLTLPLVIMPEEIETLIGHKAAIIIGDGTAKTPAHISSLINNSYQPHAKYVAQLAAYQLRQKQPGLDALPIYLKTPDVSEAKKLFWSLPDDHSSS